MPPTGVSATRAPASALALVAAGLLSLGMWWANEGPRALSDVLFFALGGVPLAIAALLYLVGVVPEGLAAGVFIGVGLPYLPLLTKLPDPTWLSEPHVWVAVSAMALCFIAGASALAPMLASDRRRR